MDTRSCLKRVAVVVALASSLLAQTTGSQLHQVTAVAGESWLNHLHRTFDETSMGKTGRLGPAEPEPEQSSGPRLPVSPGLAGHTFTLQGVDLYRMNCRGCHGEAGTGAPPEINSVINPVRAGSVPLIMERMKKSGTSMSHAEAARLARQSQAVVLAQMQHGGLDMPPFPHLSEVEIRSLVAYLKQLADVPGAHAEQLAVQETPVRVGEHIVKSTCHICHSAAGPNPDAQQLAEGAIPPLSTLATRVNQAQFVRKVTRGAPVVMGSPPLMCRGRMPVFYYLSEEEASDVYLYLSSYRPYPWATLDPVMATSQHDPAPAEADHPPRVVKSSFAAGQESARVESASDPADTQSLALLAVAGVLVTLLLAGGFGFTVRECMRLSSASEDRPLAVAEARLRAANSTNGTIDDLFVA